MAIAHQHRMIKLDGLEATQPLALPARTETIEDLPTLSDVKEDETFFMLAAIARLGTARALTERILIDPHLLNRYVGPELHELGYRATESDPCLLVHPRTRADGWIMALNDGQSLWGASYIVGGPIEGQVSKDLFYAVEQSKARITDKFFSLFKHPDLRITDELAMRNTEPTKTIFKEIKNFRDAQMYAAAHITEMAEIKAALPVYWNRPTYIQVAK